MEYFEIETPRPVYPDFGDDPFTRRLVVDPVLVEFNDRSSSFWDVETVEKVYYFSTNEVTTTQKIARVVFDREIILCPPDFTMRHIVRITVDEKFKILLARENKFPWCLRRLGF